MLILREKSPDARLGRRPFLGGTLAGLVGLTVPGVVRAVAQRGAGRPDRDRLEGQAPSRLLIDPALRAARLQVECVQLAARDDAGSRKAAQDRLRERNDQLRRARQDLDQMLGQLAPDERERLDQFFRGDGLRRFTTAARQRLVDRLRAEQAGPDDLRRLDAMVERVLGLRSLDAAARELGRHMDELIRQTSPTRTPNSLCIALLLFTSMLIVIMLAVGIVCGQTGQNCQRMLDSYLDRIC